MRLGYFATAEEAALCVARSPEGKVAAANSLMSQQARQQERQQARQRGQQARQQARAEGLTLVVAENTTGYFGVSLPYPGLPNPYQARARRDGKAVNLGSFATAEEAALYVARLRAPPLALVSKENGGRSLALPHMASDDGGGNDAGEEVEEEFEILDAVEVLDGWTD